MTPQQINSYAEEHSQRLDDLIKEVAEKEYPLVKSIIGKMRDETVLTALRAMIYRGINECRDMEYELKRKYQ